MSGDLLLIGGVGDQVPVRDFWAWHPGTGWHALAPDIIPVAGYMASAVWDSSAGVMLLVTNQGEGAWKWDGTSWSGAGPGPGQFSMSGAAYDSTHRVVLVLGQVSNATPPAPNGEAMWIWDGTIWSASPAPMSGRVESGVAYDSIHRQLVVYGGFGDADTRTWLWDGAAWKGVHTPAAPIPNQSSAAYDPNHQEVVMYAPGGETWTWNGTNWTLRSTSGPGIRRDQSMAFDPALGEVVLFGGKSPQGQTEVSHDDLWAWDGTRWIRLA